MNQTASVTSHGSACALLLVGVWLGAEPPAAHASAPITTFDEFRSFDGRGNNPNNSEWGSAGTALLRRMVGADYEDGISEPRTTGLPGAREISNAIPAPAVPRINAAGVSDFFWQWGQFIDHDIDLTEIADPAEPFDIPVPTGDPFFDPAATGTEVIPLSRSGYLDAPGVRQQTNAITAFIDASGVYGSDSTRATALRTLDGTGRMKTSPGDLLPLNENALPNAPTAHDPSFFLAGDVRANEQAALTALHTLFVREHNHQADRIRSEDPTLDGESVYQHARAIVAAELQAITYREFLPLLLGPDALPAYGGYDPAIDPGIENAFSTVIYRLGHSMLSPQLLQLAPDGQPLPQGPSPLREIFFAPRMIIDRGVEPFLRGLAAQPAREIDPFVVDDVRNFLFGEPGAGGLDLVSLNIQRGRDHGMVRYNACRAALGLTGWSDLSAISSDPEIRAGLLAAYDDVDDVDGWVGALAEDHLPGALVGETHVAMLGDQFLRLRDGDRFWYERYLTSELVDYVNAQSLSAIVRRNTPIVDIQDDVFVVDDETVAVAQGPEAPADASSILGAPFPNPAREVLSFQLDVPEGEAGRVAIEVFDARGRRVHTLHDGPLASGRHSVQWDRRDDAGRRVVAGFYFLRVRGELGVSGRKVVLLD